MSKAEAASFPWEIAGPLFGFVGLIAVVLVGLSVVGLVGRW